MSSSNRLWQICEQREPCGPPDNVSQLPDYAQAEIKDLWRSWQPGTSCDTEQLIQSDILSLVGTIDNSPTTNKKASSSNNSSGRKNTFSPLDLNDRVDTASDGSSVVLLRPDRQEHRNVIKNVHLPVEDYNDEITVDDVAMMQFDQGNAPFLKTASSKVQQEFNKIWNDDNIPSEGLRTLKIQTLAVSLLTSKQLEEYNTWATKRRRVLKAREQEIRQLSPEAKRLLRRMSRPQRDEPTAVAPRVKQELRNFAQEINRRRSKKLLH